MKNDDFIPRVPVAGIVYGQIVYWLVSLGILVALAGSIICVISTGSPNTASILGGLWNGDNIHILWEKCAGLDEPLHGYWYLFLVSWGDRTAMLGIVISCMASVFGMWGASIKMLFNPKHTRDPMKRLYFLLAVIVAIVLTLSALGMISLKH